MDTSFTECSRKMNIDGKIAVVTGGGNGIGKEIALALAREGADVVIADLNDESMQTVCSEIESLGRKTLAIKTDVPKQEAVQNLYEKSIEGMGHVDILVNNAGIHMSGAFNKTKLEDWKRIMDINLWSVIYGVHTFLPHFEERGSGYFINTGSIAGLTGVEDSSVPYTTTKFGVVGMSESLAFNLHGSGIGISVVCPSLVQTRILEDELKVDSESDKAKIREKLLGALKGKAWNEFPGMAGKVVMPEEVANLTIKAVREDRFLITTHADTMDIVQERVDDIQSLIARKATEKAERDQMLIEMVKQMSNDK